MKEVINLVSHDGSKNYLKRLERNDGQESKTYILKTSGMTLRTGQLDRNGVPVDYIDPSGGPMLYVGLSLPEADNATIRSIDFSQGFGFTITFA